MQAMDRTTADQTPPRRGILETVKGYAASVLGTTRSRVDDFSAEVQHRTLRILWMIIWTVVGVTSLFFAVCFAMLTVIFGFHLPPKYAFGIPALVFLVVGAVSLMMFAGTKRSRRHHPDKDRGSR